MSSTARPDRNSEHLRKIAGKLQEAWTSVHEAEGAEVFEGARKTGVFMLGQDHMEVLRSPITDHLLRQNSMALKGVIQAIPDRIPRAAEILSGPRASHCWLFVHCWFAVLFLGCF